jgi:hypothetical protein
MSFNKIRIMTTDKLKVIDALKNSDLVELNETYDKIRKKNICKDFIKQKL